MSHPGKSPVNQAGFTLVETLMAIILLSGGLLALATAFADGMVIVSTAHYHQIAKEKASEAIESVFTSRDTLILEWDEISNVSDGGIFIDGPQAVCATGADGLVNTADDGDVESMMLPGADNQMGTADDAMAPLNDFTREITITNLNAQLRQISVTIRYQVGNLNRQYQLITYISAFA